MQKELVIRAVDVGRANTKYIARVSPSGGVRCAMFPSIAVPSERFSAGTGAGWGKHEGATVDIPIDGLMYTVGPDVRLAADAFSAPVLQHDSYCEQPEYAALTLGALHYMNVERIDLLVVGLPVKTMKYPEIVARLEKRLRATHELGGGRSVTVKRVKTLAQPSGALMQYGVQNKCLELLRKQKSLVIDPGSRTFDWVVTLGMQQLAARSDSVDRGMFDVAAAISQAISRQYSVDYRDYDAIDVALREGGPLYVFQKEYDIKNHLALAKKIPQQAVAVMLNKIGQATDIQNVILVGGGAFFFADAVAAAFPNHNVVQLRSGMFAIVEGFQAAGMQLSRLPLEEIEPTPVEPAGVPDA